MAAKHRSEDLVSNDPRLNLTRFLMKKLATVPAQEVLPYQSETGERPFLVALPSDRVSEVSAKVERLGGANVCLWHQKHRGLIVLVMTPGLPEESEEFEGAQYIHQDIHMGMLMTFIEKNSKGGSLQLRIDVGEAKNNVPQVNRVLEFA